VYDATGLRSESVVVHLACSAPPVPQPVGTPTQPPPAAGDYVALGDSYSSGEGLSPYRDTSKCDRSDLAYGPLLGLNLGTGFVACSGAVTADISSPNHDKTINEPEQIKALSTSTNVVTLTIGGDDVGFAQVLGSCVKKKNDSTLNTGCPDKPPTSGSADQKATLAQAVDARIGALSGGDSATTPDEITIDPISTVIKEIHDAAPNAHIYIAGYPILFSQDESRYHSVTDSATGGKYEVDDNHLGGFPVEIPFVSETKDAQGAIRYSDAKWIDDEIVKINTLIKNAADAVSGVTYVDAAAQFSGHAVNDPDPWINGTAVDYAAFGDYKLNGVPCKMANCLDRKSFHPTDVGQSSGYKDAFQAKIHLLA